jgi:outer membrane protein OmpA-like peptidoglycan-associated protein
MIISMRLGVIAALVALSSPHRAFAEPVEWSGFFGVDKLPGDIALGSAQEPEQRPQTAPMLGGRVTYLPAQSRWISLGIEGEFALTTSWTGYGFDDRRPSYFAPVIGYRADVMVRLLPEWWLQPHVAGGGGGVTVASSSPFMTKDTDGVYFWGAGVTLPVEGSWLVRLDARQVWMPAMGSERTAAYELNLSLGRTLQPRALVVEHVAVAEPPPPPPILHHELVPPPPPPDLDGDGLTGDADHCPTQAEDKDGFQDDDGCPELDNDHDGIADASDKCPNLPETKNGFTDDDGCPDDVPPKITAAFEAASAVRFEPGKARITKAGKLSLAKVLAALRDNPQLEVTITGHDKDADLAKKRAEAVKWYLVDQGVAQDQLETATADADKLTITIAVRPRS